MVTQKQINMDWRSLEQSPYETDDGMSERWTGFLEAEYHAYQKIYQSNWGESGVYNLIKDLTSFINNQEKVFILDDPSMEGSSDIGIIVFELKE